MRIPLPMARRRARIEIVPLIDVIFFLLATFMVVSVSMVKNRGVPVQLPSSATAIRQDRQAYATITVTEAGDLYLDAQRITLRDLPARLEALKLANPKLQVVLHGDERASFGHTVRVLDEVRRLGIARVLIRTKPLSSSDTPS